MDILIAPFVNLLFAFHNLTGSLGWAVIIVTVLIRVALLPLLWPSLKNANKMRELQPKLKKLQEKYKDEKEKLAKAQLDLYRNEGVNPLSGCLPQIFQIAVLIMFYSAFNLVTTYNEGKVKMGDLNKHLIPYFQVKEGFSFKTDFLGMKMTAVPSQMFKEGVSPSLIAVLVMLVGSGVLQYLGAKMMMPAPKTDEAVVKKETADKEDDMMAAMRTQSLYMMPAMTIFLGWNFSVGLILYWLVNSAVMLGQQMLTEKIKK